MNINEEIILDESFGGYVNIERKSLDSLSSEYIRNLLNVSIRDGIIWRYGSESFRTIKYPSDIDLKQDIKYPTKDKDEAIKEFYSEFLILIKSIKNNDEGYLGDVKIGFNHVFDSINIGTLHDGTITGFDMNKVLSQMEHLYKNKFVDKIEYLKIKKLIKPYMTIADYDELSEELRNLHIIRWTREELIREYKILPPNRKYTLFEALHDETMVKIDVYQLYNGKYVEYSNFFILFYEESRGQYTLINLPANYFDIIEISLQKEIEKFMFSTNFLKPFKGIKRMFSLARILNDQKILEKLLPLLNGDCGLLYQIISEFDLIATMLENITNPPVKKLMIQLDALKYKLTNITKFSIDSDYLIDLINKIVDPKDKIAYLGKLHLQNSEKYNKLFDDFDYIDDCVQNLQKPGQMEKTIKTLKEIKKELQEILNGQTIKYLKNNDLYPPPPEYLPGYDKRKYQY